MFKALPNFKALISHPICKSLQQNNISFFVTLKWCNSLPLPFMPMSDRSKWKGVGQSSNLTLYGTTCRGNIYEMSFLWRCDSQQVFEDRSFLEITVPDLIWEKEKDIMLLVPKYAISVVCTLHCGRKFIHWHASIVTAWSVLW